MDAQKQIDYWKHGSEKAIRFGRGVVESGELGYGMFFAPLAVEKMLKALVVKKTGEIPPRTHKLSRLAQLAGLSLSRERLDFLVTFQIYLLEGRYEDDPAAPLDAEEVHRDLAKAEEMVEWLKKQLSA